MHKKVVLIHGNGGATADDHWFPYLKKNLEHLGLEVRAETFPDNNLAHASIWLPFLKNHLNADENTILIGHSSGAVAAMRYAEDNKLYGSILVAASYTDLGLTSEKVSGYFNNPWMWETIRKNQNWIVQFASQDDPFIPLTEAHYIHTMLQSEYTEFERLGHFVGWNEDIKRLPDTIITQIKTKLVL